MKPIKRRRLELSTSNLSEIISEELLSDVCNEVDLEIALKQQLSATLESRIEWGLLLQETIAKGNGNASGDTFRGVALDALSVVEGQSEYILTHGPAAPPSLNIHLPRPAPRKSLVSSIKPKPAFLYLRTNALINAEENDQNHLYLLKCPGCSRTSFTSLQGLLNHARLTHSLEWGTHDECIRACAVPDNDLDVGNGTEVALGPGGSLPGLRTIFQMAVGATQNRVKEDPHDANNKATILDNEASSKAGSHLIQTLGLHEDTPALASFLGKEAVRRQINVFDTNEEIDLENFNTSSHQIRPYKMSFASRNFKEDLGTETTQRIGVESVNHSDAASVEVPLSQIEMAVASNQSSRFHFIARIVITDRSIWIPPEQRPDEFKGYSHKWMISVESPSYAHDITSILNSLEVIPCDPSISIPLPPPTSNPPFVVVGRSNLSFLAKVVFSFTGTSSEQGCPDQKVAFEHWVELDPLETQSIVSGESQVLDVELDKNTVLKPPQLNTTPIGSKALWILDPLRSVKLEKKMKTEGNDQPSSDPDKASNAILTKLVKKYPMISEGNHAQGTSLPYTLVPSAEYFNSLRFGRRKAIEWGRSRAIRDAYNSTPQKTSQSALVPLTVGEVYSWLSTNGHLCKVNSEVDKGPQVKQELSEDGAKSSHLPTNKHAVTWCRICGLEISKHRTRNNLKLEDENPAKPISNVPNADTILTSDEACTIVPRALHITKLPRIDVRLPLSDIEPRIKDNRSERLALQYRPLVSAPDPFFLLSVHKLVDDLGLSSFRHLTVPAESRKDFPSYPIDQLGKHRLDIEKNLAPLGLLSLFTKEFIRVLVTRGLEVANRDNTIAASTIAPRSSSKKRNRSMQATESKPPRVLTPTHILSGILTRGRGRGPTQDSLDTVVLLCLSKLGIGVDSDSRRSCCQGEGATPLVKRED
ncbi:hypothetical protein M413DRAFT_161899 [Hebeloma cylindrosporum]|uniref:YEATS domain-containing protein n=1 Tax=Hebeloma cylindrosporum TaxID=76867 RepID=A0A0C2YH89_HEBCY|nr:hypothetical protein M413DRAFT_161899 [Hebeloma cylindrosporum h7]